MRLIQSLIIILLAQLHFASLADETYISFTPEALPPKSIQAIADLNKERLFPDGTRVRLNSKSNGVEINYSNGSTRKISFYNKVSYTSDSTQFGLTIGQPGNRGSRWILFFESADSSIRIALDVFSGTVKVARFKNPSSVTSLGLNRYLAWLDDSAVVVLDPKVFEFYRIQADLNQADPKRAIVRTIGSDTARFYAIIDGAGVLSVGAKGKLNFLPLKNLPDIRWCTGSVGDLATCILSDNSYSVISLTTGESFKSLREYTGIALTSDRKKLILRAQSRWSQWAILDLASGESSQFDLGENSGTSITALNGRFTFNKRLDPLPNGTPDFVRKYFDLALVLVTKSYFSEIREINADELQQVLKNLEWARRSRPGKYLATVPEVEVWAKTEKLLAGTKVLRSESVPEWNLYSQKSRVTFGRLNGEQKSLNLVNLGSSSSVGTMAIPSSEFAILSLFSGLKSTTYLFDLVTGRAFETPEPASVMYGWDALFAVNNQIVIRDTQRQYLINLTALRLEKRINADSGFVNRAQILELPQEILEKCDSNLANVPDPVDRKLLGWRNGETMSEEELLETLRYSLSPTEINLLAQIFQKLILEDQDSGELLFHRAGIYSRLAAQSSRIQQNPCLDQFAREVLQARLTEAFRGEDENHSYKPLSFRSIMPLIVYVPFLKDFALDNDQKREDLADRLATSVHEGGTGSDLFYSKLFYFTKAALGPFFGKPAHFVTDLTVTNSDGDVSLTLLSTYPTQQTFTDASLLGIYQTRLANKLEIPKETGASAQQSVKWSSNGHTFRADVKITNTGSLADLAPVTKGPNYQAIMKNGVFTGLVALGTNLGTKFGEDTLQNYRDFYSSLGYQFDEKIDVDNMAAWIQAHIQSGEVSYFIKEAHSDGDEKNLFRVSQKAQLLIGRRRQHENEVGDQVIYLLTPDFTNSSGEKLISNEDFGHWVRERAASQSGPMIYINSSCNSTYKVLREIAATKSPLLIDIPSVTSVGQFQNWYGNATSHLIRGLLGAQEWSRIRWMMDENSAPSRAKTYDRYILPDEPEYDEYIRKKLGFTISSEVHIFDETEGKEVNIDQFNHH